MEGELGIVIGKTCSNVSTEEADEFVFGYTCVNDVTASDILNRDPTFPQWARSSGSRRIRAVRSGHRHRDRSIEPGRAHHPQRRGAPELSDIRHDLQRTSNLVSKSRTT